MRNLPKVICSSVVRTSQQGESHGGIYLVDLQNGETREVLNWNDEKINWEGRGGDRGLRGIAFYDGLILCAASNELLFFNRDFDIVERYSNAYLQHCHEIAVEGGTLYLSSTGFDSVLTFDLASRSFQWGYCLRKRYKKNAVFRAARKYRLLPVAWMYRFSKFHCNESNGPERGDSTHINNVFARNGRVFFSGTELNCLYEIDKNGQLSVKSPIHSGTHNVQLVGDYIIYNNTKNDCISAIPIEAKKGNEPFEFPHPEVEQAQLQHGDAPKDHARSNFARGLCSTGDLLIGGTSPSTLHVYSLSEKKLLKSVVLSRDVRNAIHGLEIVPEGLLGE